jgi:hypothetical protein
MDEENRFFQNMDMKVVLRTPNRESRESSEVRVSCCCLHLGLSV